MWLPKTIAAAGLEPPVVVLQSELVTVIIPMACSLAALKPTQLFTLSWNTYILHEGKFRVVCASLNFRLEVSSSGQMGLLAFFLFSDFSFPKTVFAWIYLIEKDFITAIFSQDIDEYINGEKCVLLLLRWKDTRERTCLCCNCRRWKIQELTDNGCPVGSNLSVVLPEMPLVQIRTNFGSTS